MASKHAPKPAKHPRFIPTDVPDGHAWAIGNAYYIRLVRESLTQAWKLTPWYRGVVLLVRHSDFQAIANAVALVAGPVQGLRVFLKPRRSLPEDKRVMIDPAGRDNTAIPCPWGDPPATVPEPLTEAEFNALNTGEFPPAVPPAEK